MNMAGMVRKGIYKYCRCGHGRYKYVDVVRTGRTIVGVARTGIKVIVGVVKTGVIMYNY